MNRAAIVSAGDASAASALTTEIAKNALRQSCIARFRDMTEIRTCFVRHPRADGKESEEESVAGMRASRGGELRGHRRVQHVKTRRRRWNDLQIVMIAEHNLP